MHFSRGVGSIHFIVFRVTFKLILKLRIGISLNPNAFEVLGFDRGKLE